MKLTYTVNGNEVEARLEGMLDTAASQQIQQDFRALEQLASKHITVDCSKLSYMASAGLRQLLSLRQKSLSANGTLVLKNLNDTVREVFDITNFSNIFHIL